MPPLAPAKVLRSDVVVPTRRRSSRASRAAASTATAASGDSRGVAEVTELQPAATTTEPPRVAAEAQQVVSVVGRGNRRRLWSRSRRRQSQWQPRAWRSPRRRLCRRPPRPAARERWWWRSPTMTSRHRAGISGRARLRQPPRPRRGRLWSGATSVQCWGAQRTASGPRRRPGGARALVEAL
jgi:hypothetical protein